MQELMNRASLLRDLINATPAEFSNSLLKANKKPVSKIKQKTNKIHTLLIYIYANMNCTLYLYILLFKILNIQLNFLKAIIKANRKKYSDFQHI